MDWIGLDWIGLDWNLQNPFGGLEVPSLVPFRSSLISYWFNLISIIILRGNGPKGFPT